MPKLGVAAFVLTVLVLTSVYAEQRRFPSLGRAATESEIKAWDIAIGPAGKELPPGAGNVDDGAKIYAKQCAYCHGENGEEGPDHRLVGGHGSLVADKPILTIGSYWRYATTVFDYINRAMPFLTPGSLSADEVYAVTAFLLYKNGIIEQQLVLSDSNLATIEMPNRAGFVPDPRPEKFIEGRFHE
ncbi:MAG: c-type cytochrome [Gammaproteobacteria bacterium]